MTSKAKNNLRIIAAMAELVATTTLCTMLLSWWSAIIGFALFWVAIILLRGSEQKVVYNSVLPFPRFKCINICGYLLARSELTEKNVNHESIHTEQMKELWYIGFYLWYFGEWLYQSIVRIFNSEMKAYCYITMEQEAYENDDNLEYLATRVKYAWWKYIGQWVKY